MSKIKDPAAPKEQKKNSIFWKIMSIFAIFIIGYLTSGLLLYEGHTLARIKKENRAQLRKERERRKKLAESQNDNNSTKDKNLLGKMKPNILEELRN